MDRQHVNVTYKITSRIMRLKTNANAVLKHTSSDKTVNCTCESVANMQSKAVAFRCVRYIGIIQAACQASNSFL